MRLEQERKLHLEEYWQKIKIKNISYRKEGESYLVTTSDRSPIGYNSSDGNISVFYTNVSCLSIYELLKKHNGDIIYVIEQLVAKGLTHEESVLRIEKTLNILLMNMDFFSTDFKKQEYPYFAHIDIIAECNLNCTHCLNPQDIYKDRDMSTSEWLNVIDQFVRLGITILWIGGGEPLLRTDLLVILEYAKSKNMRIVLATNGILLNNFIFSTRLLQLIDELTICLDGSSETIHGYFRKPSDCFDTICNNIESVTRIALQERCLVKIFTCVARHNIFDIENIIDLAYKLGVDAWACQTLVLMNRAKDLEKELLTFAMREHLASVLKKKRDVYLNKMYIQYYVPLLTMEKVYSKPTMSCSAGNAIIYINSEGEIYPCSRLVFDKFKIGNIKKIDIKKEWLENKVFNQFRNIDNTVSECSKCQYFTDGMCNGGCKAEKYRYYGDIYLNADPNCQRMNKKGYSKNSEAHLDL